MLSHRLLPNCNKSELYDAVRSLDRKADDETMMAYITRCKENLLSKKQELYILTPQLIDTFLKECIVNIGNSKEETLVYKATISDGHLVYESKPDWSFPPTDPRKRKGYLAFPFVIQDGLLKAAPKLQTTSGLMKHVTLSNGEPVHASGIFWIERKEGKFKIVYITSSTGIHAFGDQNMFNVQQFLQCKFSEDGSKIYNYQDGRFFKPIPNYIANPTFQNQVPPIMPVPVLTQPNAMPGLFIGATAPIPLALSDEQIKAFREGPVSMLFGINKPHHNDSNPNVQQTENPEHSLDDQPSSQAVLGKSQPPVSLVNLEESNPDVQENDLGKKTIKPRKRDLKSKNKKK